MQISNSSIHQALKGSYTNPKCVKNSLTTHYNNYCWIKYLELQAKYLLGLMQFCGSQKNFWDSSKKDRGIAPKTKIIPKKDNEQAKVLAIQKLTQSYALIDRADNIYKCNFLRLITNFRNNPTKVRSWNSGSISLGRRIVKVSLVLENGREDLILTLKLLLHSKQPLKLSQPRRL